VLVGTHLVGESGNSTNLVNYSVEISCLDNNGTGSAVPATPNGVYGWDVTVNEGDDIVCTITNERKGTINIVKEATPADDTVFTFNDNIAGTFFLQDPFDDRESYTNIAPGNYMVTEVSIPSGWSLTDITCVEDQVANSTEDKANARALITLDPGETVSCTFTNLLNQPPVANNDNYSTNEDTALVEATVGPLGDGVLANDTDVENDLLTAVLDTPTSNGVLVLSSDGSFTYTPTANTCGADSFTYHANDGSADSNVATVSIDVVCVDDPPTVSVGITSQTVQYSDSISPVTITASDIDSANLSISHNAPSSLSTSGSCTPDGTGGTNCTWTLSGQVLVAAATYDVILTVSDATTGVTANTQVVVTPEDADVSFDSDNPVAVRVSSNGGDSEPFSLLVHVQESSESGSGVLPGDINLANVSVTLESVGPGSSVTVNCTSIGAVTAFDYSAVLEVTCDFSGVPVNTYTVMVTVGGGYYSGSGEDVLVVYDPSLGFTTGGGWFYWPDTTDRTNFGYTMKYNKKGQKVKGSLLLIRHLSDGTKYRVKSNALDGLALGDYGSFGWATFSGKSTYLEPGWPEPVGNHHFVAYVEDHGEPGAGADRFWLEVADKDGNTVTLSMDREAVANAVFLEGGNIVVPHGGGDKGRGK
jgi:VCBS repeat-containing protein